SGFDDVPGSRATENPPAIAPHADMRVLDAVSSLTRRCRTSGPTAAAQFLTQRSRRGGLVQRSARGIDPFATPATALAPTAPRRPRHALGRDAVGAGTTGEHSHSGPSSSRNAIAQGVTRCGAGAAPTLC